jgi:hypothetical protein
MGVALLAGWLGVSASARAQFPPPQGLGGPGQPPPAGFAGAPAPPGDGSQPVLPAFCPPPPPVDGPMGHPETLPANGFSNVHPEQEPGPPPCLYVGAEYLFWWMRREQVPPLVTVGGVLDVPAGASLQPNTIPSLGPGSLGPQNANGVRANALFWFNHDHNVGIEASGFYMEHRTSTYVDGGFANIGTVVIARPFFDANALIANADPILVPNAQSGFLVTTMPRDFYGAEANARLSCCVDCGVISRISLLGGVRYLYLHESLLFAETTFDAADSVGNTGIATSSHDDFSAWNRYYGAQLGLETETRVGQMVLTLTSKVGAGRNYQEINVAGNTTLADQFGNVTVDNSRGLLVQPSNVGRFTRHDTSIVAELAASLAWEFNDHVRLSLGYNFLYWSKVVRPGDQVDTTVNVGALGAPFQFVGTPLAGHPLMPFRSSAFWAEGVTVGLEVAY